MNSHTTGSWTRWLPAIQVSDSMHAVLNREAELIDEYQLTPVMDMLAKISEVVAQQRIACRMFGPGNCLLLLHLLQLTPINPISFGLHSERFFISKEITPHCHVDPLHVGLIQSLIDQLDGTGHSIRLFPASNDEMRPYDVSHRIREGLLRKADDGDRRAKRMNREEIRELLDLIQAVAPQLTCKARGLDAAIPLWRSAYLKTHFPDVFHEVTAQGGGSLQ